MWLHFCEVPRVIRFIETERMVGARGWGREGIQSDCLTGTVSNMQGERVLEVDCTAV